jgi:hypothetical protein
MWRGFAQSLAPESSVNRRGIDCPRMARISTETLNISEYQCNQWEYMSLVKNIIAERCPQWEEITKKEMGKFPISFSFYLITDH